MLCVQFHLQPEMVPLGLPWWLSGKESACSAGDPGSIPGSGIEFPTRVQPLGGEDPLEEGMVTHSSVLAQRIPMNRGAWRATVHRVTKHWNGLLKSPLRRLLTLPLSPPAGPSWPSCLSQAAQY